MKKPELNIHTAGNPKEERIPGLNTKVSLKHFLMLFCVLCISCEVTLDPIEPDPTEPFSIFGSLDASSTRNWVRVTPIRDSLFSAQPDIDAEVTLLDHSTNEVIELQDSVSQRVVRGNQLTYFTNYWLDYSLLPNQTYTLTARNSDGYSSSATVTIPDEYEVPIIEASEQGVVLDNAKIIGTGVERVVILDVAYDLFVFRDGEGRPEKVVVSQLFDGDLLQFDNGEFEGRINDLDFLRRRFNVSAASGEYIRVDSAKIFMAAGNDSWPDTEAYTLEDLTIPQSGTNVENGIGVLVGINTLVFPFQSCKQNDEFVPCEPLNIPYETVFEYRRFQDEQLNQ